MSEWVEVKQGDSIIGIAAAHGFRSWETIWNDPQNSLLRSRRSNPFVLVMGDLVFVPDKDRGQRLCQTDEEHVFRVKALTAWVRLIVADDDDQPLARRRFELVAGGTTYSGRTGDDGLVAQKVRPDARDGKLTVYLDDSNPDNKLEWTVAIGHLAPAETRAGLRQRLENLGFSCGGETGEAELGTQTTHALREFQADAGIPVTGTDDPATLEQLRNAHNAH